MEHIFVISGQVAVLFLLMAVGATLRKVKLLSDASVEGMVNLLILVVTPCLIVDVFQRPFSPSTLRGLLIAFAIAVAGHLAAIAAAYLFVRHPDENVCRPMRLAAVFSNAGFMGLPLEQAVLGDAGVFYGVVYIVVFNLFMWSWGYNVMKKEDVRGKKEKEGKPLTSNLLPLTSVLNPGTVGIAFGLPLFFLSAKLPAFVGTPVHLLAGLNTPLAMIVIGYGLAGAKLGRAVRTPVLHVAAFIRLIAYPLLIVAALYPFRQALDRDMMLATTIAASAPVAAMVSMFSAKFGRDVDTSVAMVSGTTLLSILTMPVVIALAMKVL